MPALDGKVNGQSVFDLITFDGIDPEQYTRELQGLNLPGVNLWLSQTDGPVCTFTLQFANRQGINGPDWATLAKGVLAVNTEILVNRRLGSRMYRVFLECAGVAHVYYRLTASIT